ncbi:DUF5801 repeats-in-toxin domain-containing protein, partial [Halomonas maura]|uniref:DUF5801 repeats-in-toxin domain-containing protein n=1 Tax=Halomonas maura TaxID=117606 RepID=UPI0025B4C460
MSEDILQVANPITVDESPGVTDDEITVAAGQLILPDLYTEFGTPENIACKTGMISTPEGVTAIGWAADEDGNPVSDLASGLTALDPDSGGYEAVTLDTAPGDDNVLIGTTTSGHVAFVAVIVEAEDGLSSDVYLLDYLPKQHPDDTDPDDTVTLDSLFVNVAVEEDIEFDFEGAPSGNNDFMAFGEPDGVAIVVTGRTPGEEVNSSKSGNEPTSLAANSNNINVGEGLVVTYVNDMEDNYIVPDLSGPEANDPNNIQFDSLQTATEASVTIVKVGPGSTTATVHITALSTEQEEGAGFIPGINDDETVPITAVFVNGDPVDLVTLEGSDTVIITGITNNDEITFVTEGDHNRVVVENGGTGNARFNLGGVAIADVTTVSDADPVTLAFDDDAPAVDANATVQLDDDALPDGNAGGVGDDPDGVNTTGTLAHDFGADGPGSIEWLESGAPSGFSYALNGDDLEISQDGEGVVLTLTVDGDGNYTVTQNSPILHVPGNNENNQAFTVGYRVTDGDDDFVDGSLAIDVDDDTPVVDAGAEAPSLEVDESDFATDATASFAAVFAPSFGADGPGAGGGLSYALSVTDPASGLVDTLTGQDVTLALDGGDVVGSNDDGDEVLRIGVDGDGNVTLDQSRAVVHPDDSDPDDLITLAADKVGLTAMATDGDDDSAELTIDLSPSLGLRDDGPTVDAGAEAPALEVDESDFATDDTASFAAVFDPSFGADGPGAGGGLSYALSVTDPASGLVDTLTGQPVTLALDGDDVVGSNDDGDEVLRISVDGDGNVTLDQSRAVVHPDDSDPDDLITLAADKVGLTATATDGDDDSAELTIDLSPSLGLRDDGPAVDAGAEAPALEVDESDFATDDTASFAAVFAPSFGADGPGAGGGLSYALSVTDPASGLTDTLTGQPVTLALDGDDVVGSNDDGDEVLRIGVDGDGNVTLDQSRAVVHPDDSDPDDLITLAADKVGLTATATDGDDDSAELTIDLSPSLGLRDDGPAVVAGAEAPSLEVDESDFATDATASFAAVFDPSFGADGPGAGGGLSYALSVTDPASGLVDTLTGQDVTLALDGDDVVGSNDDGDEVLRIGVDGDGNVTLDQSRAVVHPDDSDPDDLITLTADKVGLTATATDGDDDSAELTIDLSPSLGLRDDGPAVVAGAAAPSLEVDESDFATDATASFAAVFAP